MEPPNDKWNAIKILIADRDRLNFEYFRKLIARWGGISVYTDNGKDLLNSCIRDQQIMLVVVDLKICTTDCRDLLHQLKRSRPDLFLVALSSYGPAYNRQQCIQWGFDEYISLPVLPGIFYRTIHNLVLQLKSVGR